MSQLGGSWGHLNKGVTGGPSEPSRESPGVGHKIVLDTKQMIKKRKKKRKKGVGKRKNVLRKKMEKREREKWK